MKIRTEKVIESQDWDQLITETYGKPYCFQQQDGCRDRGVFRFTVPDTEFANENDNEMHDSIPEKVNGPLMGVKFKQWLKRDPKQPLADEDENRTDQWGIDLWWHRNFYPDFQTLANDLHAKGKIEAGDYTINIDW